MQGWGRRTEGCRHGKPVLEHAADTNSITNSVTNVFLRAKGIWRAPQKKPRRGNATLCDSTGKEGADAGRVRVS